MALHGHTRLELTDVHTGEVQTVEHDNLITNAVSRIFAAFPELMNGRDKLYDGSGSLWSRFYGGLLLLDTAITGDADTLYAPAGVDITGTARYNAVNAGLNTRRGSYNATESALNYEDKELRLVYDFTTSQANGTIAAACLTSRNAAMLGEMPQSCAALTTVVPGEMDFLWGEQINLFPGTKARKFYENYGSPVLVDLDTDTVWCARLVLSTSTKALRLYKAGAQLRSISLLQDAGANRSMGYTLAKEIDLSDIVQSTYTSTVRVDYDEERGRLYVVAGGTSGSTTMKVLEINMADWSQTVYTFTNTLSETLDTTLYSEASPPCIHGKVYNGRLYFRTTAGNLYSVPLEDPTDVTPINRNGLEFSTLFDAHHGRIYSSYGNTVRVLDTLKNAVFCTEMGACHCYDTVPLTGGGPVTLRVRSPYSGDNLNMCYPCVREPYLGSINNLDSPVTKTASQTMKVTYTIRES